MPEPIQRWALGSNSKIFSVYGADGDWVLYEDHLAALGRTEGEAMSERRCPQCEAAMALADECHECVALGNTPMRDGRIPLKRQTLTHCKDGHLFTEENTYWRKRKDRPTKASRICKICRLESERIHRFKAKQ